MVPVIYESVRLSLNALQLAAKNRHETRVWREAAAAQVKAKDDMTRRLLAQAHFQEVELYHRVMAQAVAEKLRYFRNMHDARLESYRLYWSQMAARLAAYREYQRVVEEGVKRYRAWKRKVERDLNEYRAEQRQQEKKTQAYRLALKREAEAFLNYTQELANTGKKIRQNQIQYAGRKAYNSTWAKDNKNNSSARTSELQMQA